MPTNESSRPFEKLSDEAKDRVLDQLKEIMDAGELRFKSDDPGERAKANLERDRLADASEDEGIGSEEE